MPRRRVESYLTTLRKSEGLTQAELGALVGCSEDYVRKCERTKKPPTLRFAIGCMIVFRKSIVAIFPQLVDDLHDALARRAAKIDERLRGKKDAKSIKTLRLLSNVAKEAPTKHDL